MRNIIYDRKGVSNILGYLFSFGVASMLMISAVIITTNILDKRTAAVAGMQAQSIANKVADAIVEAVAVLQSPSNVGYKKTLDMPMDLAGRDYYVDVTDKMIYVNTTDGLVSKSCPTYTAEDLKIGVGGGRTYCGGIGKINVSVDKSDNIFVADTNNHSIRRILPGTCNVLTVAGDGVEGDGYRVNGQVSGYGRLRNPRSIACTPSGRVYVFDTGNHKIKLWETNFNLLRFSGTGNPGFAIGNADVCEYNELSFSDVDNTGNIYVVDYAFENSRLLRVNTNGVSAIIKDFAGTGIGRYVVGVAVNNSGTVYATESEYIYFQSSSSSSSGNDYNKITENSYNRVTEFGINMIHEGNPF